MQKKILFVIPYAPNLIRVRPYNLIRATAERGHRVTVLTLWSDEAERDSLSVLEPLVERLVALRLSRWRALGNAAQALPTRRPLQADYCWQPELARLLAEMTRAENGSLPFDVAHVEHLRGARYGLHLNALFAGKVPRLPVLWDSVDSISLLFRQALRQSRTLFGRAVTRLEIGRTEGYEAWLLGQFDSVTVTSPNDLKAFQALRPGAEMPVSVLPNGVDLEYFSPDPSQSRDPATLVISGKMSYHANVTMVLRFVEEVLPAIRARRPETRLLVVGKDPTREVLALGEREQITVTGTVPHLPPYLRQATVAIAPVAYGAGIQNKVLEAMACATPVVASSQAVSALQACPGEDVLVADEPEAFAAQVLRLLENPAEAAALGGAGRRYVEEHHDWDRVAARLEQLYEGAMQRAIQQATPGERVPVA